MKKNIKYFTDIIENELQKNASKEKKDAIEKYMRFVQKFRGLKNPEIQNIFKNIWKEHLSSLDILTKIEIALSLLKFDYGEDKYFSMMIYNKIIKDIDLNDIKDVEKVFKDGSLVGWANTDGICGRIFRGWATGNESNCNFIAEWSKSDNIWLQRASCVSFVTLARHGDDSPNFIGFTKVLENICDTTIKNPERFVQLGTGWLLREIGVQDRNRLINFIEKRIEYFSREGLRYAIEKLSSSDKKRMLGLSIKPKLDNTEAFILKSEPRKKSKLQ